MPETEAARRQNALVEEHRRNLATTVRRVLSSPEGRRFVYHLLDEICGVFGPSWTGEALSGAYAEGRRSAGLSIMKELQDWAPAEFVHLLGEERALAMERLATLSRREDTE